MERGNPASPLKIQDFELVHESLAPLRQLKLAGFLIFATTNQPGLSRGYLCRSELNLMHRLLRAAYPLDDILICPHDEMDRCPCRKPKPGLITEAAFKWHLSLEQSYVISDKWQDAEVARLAGCTSVLMQSPWVGPVHHDFIVSSFAMAVDKVLKFHQAQGAFCEVGNRLS
jgi:D-glycero-D-manno-heptose 1,7-bisphosphate phosphatase